MEFWEPLRLGKCQLLYWVLTVLTAVDEVPVMLSVCVFIPCPGTSGCVLGVMVFIAAGASV